MRSAGLLLAMAGGARAQPADLPAPEPWTVDGVPREAYVFAPPTARSQPTPILFFFHGHGGKAWQAAKGQHFQTLWPEAIVVYPQALNTPGILHDPEGKKPGWQPRPGMEGDRDVKFFDAMLASLRQKYKVDDKRVYVAGFSSGGGFTYILWKMRGAEITAVSPASAVAPELAAMVPTLKPMPAFLMSGTQELTIDMQHEVIAAVAKLNGCGPGQPTEPDCTFYPSATGTPLLTYLFDANHSYPHDAAGKVVKFFQEYGQGGGAAGKAP